MKKLVAVLSVFLTIFVFSGCAASNNTVNDTPNDAVNDNTMQQDKVTLIQTRFASPNYAGDYVAADSIDENYNIDMEVTPGGEGINPIQLVVAGQYDIGVGVGADQVAQANANGANLVILGFVSYRNQTCFMTKEEDNINTPQDFVGKTIGTLEGTSSHTVYKELMEQNNISRDDVEEIGAPFDINSFIATNSYDVRPAFCNDEPIVLDIQDIPYVIIEPQDYGVDLVGAVYFARENRVEENTELARNTVYALIDGWKEVIENPESGLEATLRRDDSIDEEYSRRLLDAGIEKYYQGEDNKVLYASPERVQNTLEITSKYDETIPTSLEGLLKLDFVNEYHNQN